VTHHRGGAAGAIRGPQRDIFALHERAINMSRCSGGLRAAEDKREQLCDSDSEGEPSLQKSGSVVPCGSDGRWRRPTDAEWPHNEICPRGPQSLPCTAGTNWTRPPKKARWPFLPVATIHGRSELGRPSDVPDKCIGHPGSVVLLGTRPGKAKVGPNQDCPRWSMASDGDGMVHRSSTPCACTG